jgi:hypothetical protein
MVSGLGRRPAMTFPASFHDRTGKRRLPAGASREPAINLKAPEFRTA